MARLFGIATLALCALATVLADEDDIEVESTKQKKAPEPAAPTQVFLTEDNLADVTESENWKPWAVLFQDDDFEQATGESPHHITGLEPAPIL